MMNRKISRYVSAAAVLSIGLCMFPHTAVMAAGETGSVKDVYIDNTVDNSVSYVTGTIHIAGSGGE